MMTRRFHVVTAALVLLLVGSAGAATRVSFIRTTGRTVEAHWARKAALFGDGSVLLFGSNRTLERYDPLTETFSSLGGETILRENPAGVSLPDGTVLVCGGSNGAVYRSAFVIQSNGTRTPVGDMAFGRTGATATLLANGKVLIAGGSGDPDGADTGEIYDPATQQFTLLASKMTQYTSGHDAVRLADGTVLIAGADWRAHRFDPSTNTFTRVGDLAVRIGAGRMALLPDGRVLLAAGSEPLGPTNKAQLFDPSTNSWTVLTTVSGHVAGSVTALPSGRVLIAGGHNASGQPAGAELYDPVTNTFTSLGPTLQDRYRAGVVVLADGRVLIAGGDVDANAEPYGELYREGGFASPRTDASFDLRSDVWWRHTNGTNTFWFSQGAGTTSASPPAYGAQWQLKTVADFDGNGSMDAFWRDPSTGANEIWLMNGTQRLVRSGLYPLADPNWNVAGSGDFNGDARYDVLWRNATTGESVIWLMNGYQAIDGGHIPRIADTNWQLGAIGDYDGDGKDDLLWRNGVTGENVIWLMNGLTAVNGSHIFGQPDFNFVLAASGDFDGDGKADLLWRNDLTGQSVVWLVNGLNVVNGSPLPTQPDGNWNFLAAGDYDRSGTTDVLWQHRFSGEVVVWYVNGFQVTGASSWGVAGPGWTAHWK